MKNIFFVSLAILLAQAYAADLTTNAAKNKAQRLLETMNKVEHVTTIDRVLQDPSALARSFSTPLNRELDNWPSPWYAKENKSIEPYQLCAEAGLALIQLADERRKTGDSMAPGVVKHRGEYQDKKLRCEQSIKTGRYTPKPTL